MSLSDLASIGSFVSGIAVIVTLMFLLLQMRQADRNQRSLMQQGRSARMIEILLRRTEPYLSHALTRASVADPEMDASQCHAFLIYGSTIFMHFEDSFLQHRAGTIDPSIWEADVVTLRAFLMAPAYRAAWQATRLTLAGDYRDFVDNLKRETAVMAQPIEWSAVWKNLVAAELPAR